MGYIFTVVNMGLLRAIETMGLLRQEKQWAFYGA